MTAFVGRGPELAELRETFHRAREGQGATVFVTADAGGGKTSLVEHFLQVVEAEAPEARIATGTCSEQYGSGEPYQAFVEAFSDLVKAAEDPRGGGGSRLRDAAKRLAPYWLSAIPVAGSLVAATWQTARELKEAKVEPDGKAGSASAPPNEEALFYQYTEMLFAAADSSPVVLFLDDLHWADQATCALLGHLGRRVGDKPVLLLGTYRPADVEVSRHPVKKTRQELERYGVATELELSPLEAESLVELVEAELGAPPSSRLLDFLRKRAGTNPLYFGELLRWVVDKGYCREVRGEWTFVRMPEEIEVPRSAESTIQKRLDRLDDEVRRILEYASVQGDEFDSTVLSRLLEMDELELEERLEDVVRVHKLVRAVGERDFPAGDFATVYRFRHSLIQDVLHRNLFGKRRVLLHRKVADILEELYGDETGPVDWALAVHHDEGRHPEKAFRAAVRAADRAASLYAHLDAIELLERALRNAPSEAGRIDVLERLAEQHRVLGRFPEALQHLDEALELARSGDDPGRVLALRRQAVAVDVDFGERTVPELWDELEELAADARDRVEGKEELCRILWCFRTLPGEEPGGRKLSALEEALEIARGLGREDLLARAHYALGAALTVEADPGRAVGHLEEALDLYDRQSNRLYTGYCHNGLAVAHTLRGDYDAAREAFARAADAFEEVGDPVETASVRNNLGVVLTRVGRWDEAERNLRDSLALAERLDATPRLLSPLENLARLCRQRGDPERAARHWDRLLELARETGYWTTEAVAMCGLGRVQVERGRLDEARASLEAARELADAGEEGWEVREAVWSLEAHLSAREGDWATAAEAARRMEEEAVERDRYTWATCLLMKAEALDRLGRPGAADAAEEALDTFRALGAEPGAREARELTDRIRAGRAGEAAGSQAPSGSPR